MKIFGDISNVIVVSAAGAVLTAMVLWSPNGELWGVSQAFAQTVVCNVSGSGSNPCHFDVTIAGSIAIDNSTTINNNTKVIVIGEKPKHGWSVHHSTDGAKCWASDNGDAYLNSGFPTPYDTPLGYSPMGPVSVYCTGKSGTRTNLAVRQW